MREFTPPITPLKNKGPVNSTFTGLSAEKEGYNQNDLARIVGFKSRASEILNRKRKLSLEMIRQLHERLHIPTDALIQAY